MANQTGRRLNQAAVIIFLLTGLLITTAALGFFDPLTIQNPSWQSYPIGLVIESGEREFNWLNAEIPDSPFSLRLSAAYTSGEEDIGYGLVIDQGDRWLVIEVSPLGYAAIWQVVADGPRGQEVYELPWQAWPHIRQSTNSNEIWVNIDGMNILVRVNREWFWEGELNGDVLDLGIIGESFGKDSTVTFDKVEVIPFKHS